MSLHEFQLPVPGRGTIHGDLHFPANDAAGPLPVVVLAMGLLKFKDWGFYPHLCRRIADRGYLAVSWNPALSGVADRRDGTVVDEVAAAKATLSAEVDDLRVLVDALRRRVLPGLERVDVERLALVGHSQGSGIAFLAAAGRSHVGAVVGLSPVATFRRFSTAEVQRIQKEGFIEVKLEGRHARLTKAYLDDLHDNEAALNLENALGAIPSPLLLIHGEENHIIDVSEAERIYHWSNKSRSKLALLEKTGHTFGACHPFEETNGDLERAIEIVGNFLDQTFRPSSAVESP